MTTRRQPCRACRSRIDQDWTACPHCGIDDPLRHRRHARHAGTALALVVVVVVALAVGLPKLLH